MNHALRYSRLDLDAMRPYALSMLVPLLLVLPTAWLEPLLVVSLLPLLVAIVASSYVFSLDESSGLELLRTLLPGARQAAVKGRYLLLLYAVLGGFAIALITALCAGVTGRGSLEGLSVATALSVCSVCGFLAVQTPLYFAFGYTRARYWGYALFIAISGLFGAVVFVAPMLARVLLTGAAPLVLVAGSVGLLWVSFLVSCHVSRSRDI